MKVKVINRSAYGLPQYETGQAAGLDVRANITESTKSRQNLVCTKSNFCKRNLAQIAWQQASNSGRNCA